MPRLGYGDRQAVVELLGVACELEGAEPFPIEFLAELKRFTDAASISYWSIDRRTQTSECGGYFEDLDELDPAIAEELERRYWETIWSCPTFAHQDRTGDRRALRVSDVISRRAYHALPIYREYFRPSGVEWGLEAPLPAPQGLDRFLMLWRMPHDRDFAASDRDLLEVLRPHLGRMQERAELRGLLARHSVAADVLTPREQEILELVAEGKTNAEVAALLWIAPSTVKKHLENVYEKLDVRGRAAAVNARRLGA